MNTINTVHYNSILIREKQLIKSLNLMLKVVLNLNIGKPTSRIDGKIVQVPRIISMSLKYN